MCVKWIRQQNTTRHTYIHTQHKHIAYMGDTSGSLNSAALLIEQIIDKCSEYSQLRNEFTAQLIKQLTENPNPRSSEKGWNLLMIFIDTFKPSKEIENYFESWIRSHPPQLSHDVNVLQVLHTTYFLGNREITPTADDIMTLLEGRGYINNKFFFLFFFFFLFCACVLRVCTYP